MLRNATISDVEAITDLFMSSKLNEYYRRSHVVIALDINEALKNGEQILLYEDDDSTDRKLAGYVRFIPKGAFGHFAHMDTIIVSDKYRRKGIGTILMEGMFERIQSKNWNTKVFLNVINDNREALEFYNKLGFIRIGEIDSLFKKGITEVVMYRNLMYHFGSEVT